MSKQGIYIDSEPNHDKKANPDVVEYQHYVCGLRISEEEYTVHSIVAVDRNGNRYYDHKLSHIEKGKLLDLIEAKQSAEQILATTPGTKPTIRSERKIKELIQLLQVNEPEDSYNYRFSDGESDNSGENADDRISFRDAPSAIGDEAEVARALDVMEAEGVEVVRSLAEMPNDHEAYHAITDGHNITGWYDTKTCKVYLYAPGIKSMSDLMRTMRHEGIAHLGLRELLGKEDFGDLCDKVWRELMTTNERKAMIAYVKKMSVDEFGQMPLEEQAEAIADRRNQRAAADEFMAFMGEDGSYAKAGLWERITTWIRDLLRKIGLNLKITKADVMRLLRRSEKAKYGARGVTGKISGSQADVNPEKGLSLQGKKLNNNGRQETDTAERVEDGRRRGNRRGVASQDATQRMVAAGDRSGIRVFEEGLSLHIGNIQSVAREIDAKRNPKGW